MAESISAFALGDSISKFALISRDSKGMYRSEKLLDMGLPEAFATESAVGENKDNQASKGSALHEVKLSALNPKYRYNSADFVVHTPDFLILAAGQTGFIWILDKRKEVPSLNFRKLFGCVNEKSLAKPDEIEWSILGMQPMPDGDVLIASRSEDAVKHARQLFPTPTLHLKLMQDPAHMKQREQNMKDSVEFYPEICWWKLDPESGVITRVDPPVNFPTKLPSLKAMMGFRFRPKLNGDLEIEH